MAHPDNGISFSAIKINGLPYHGKNLNCVLLSERNLTFRDEKTEGIENVCDC